MVTSGKCGKANKGKEDQMYGDKENLTLDSEHAMKYTCDILWNCTFESCIILLTNVALINLIKK